MTPLQYAKQGLCYHLNKCDGSFLLPCGDKKDDPSYCEEWKKMPLKRKDLIIDDEGDISISPITMAMVLEKLGRGGD